MQPIAVLAAQFVWFLCAWSAIALLLIAPRVRRLEPEEQLSIWLAPQLLRVLGLGLLVPPLAPDMPASFALPTAIGDSATAVLALLALLALARRARGARALAWTCTAFGSADLLVAMIGAARAGAADHLAAQWFVPALGVPLMIVAHGMAFATLLRTRPSLPRARR